MVYNPTWSDILARPVRQNVNLRSKNMLRLDLIPGLREEDSRFDWVYQRRDKHDDMDMTRAYYEDSPPQVGDLVVVLHTYSHIDMDKPHVTTIDAITNRGRLVVNHMHEGWAGKSFWKSGQNCKAPKGQCWLVPAALYRDIPVTHEVDRQRRFDKLYGRKA